MFLHGVSTASSYWHSLDIRPSAIPSISTGNIETRKRNSVPNLAFYLLIEMVLCTTLADCRPSIAVHKTTVWAVKFVMTYVNALKLWQPRKVC